MSDLRHNFLLLPKINISAHQASHPTIGRTFTTGVYGPHDLWLTQRTTTGRPFFNDRAWEIMETVLENIQRGYHTDPPVTKMPCLHGRNNML